VGLNVLSYAAACAQGQPQQQDRFAQWHSVVEVNWMRSSCVLLLAVYGGYDCLLVACVTVSEHIAATLAAQVWSIRAIVTMAQSLHVHAYTEAR
jgi:hypothetical protein